MQKVWKVILVLSIATNLVLGFILLDKPRMNPTDSKVYIKKIDSLESVIDSLGIKRDSIKEEIDTVRIYLDKVNASYEEDRSVIINNSVSDDYLFFSEYRTYSLRFMADWLQIFPSLSPDKRASFVNSLVRIKSSRQKWYSLFPLLSGFSSPF